MVKGCEAFVSAFEDPLLDSLVARKKYDSVENKICITETKACAGSTKDESSEGEQSKDL